MSIKHKRQGKKLREKKQLLLITWLVAVIILVFWSTNYFYPRYFAASPQLPGPPLKDLAASRGVELSVLVKPNWLQRKPFEGIVGTQFSSVTSDGELHWDKLRPSPAAYNFTAMDKIVAYAQDHHMAVQGHHLLWDEADSLPEWLKNGNYSQSQLMGLIQDHISTVVSHYKGKVSEWTVVNEPFTRAKHTYGLDYWWGDHLGNNTNYIDKAFTWAHVADPNAKLILNDFNNETENDTSDAQYSYMKSAKDRGVPINGIGMQLHIDASKPPNKDAMVKNMKRFGDIGYSVFVTEFDISSVSVKGTSEFKNNLEAKITANVVEACVESKNCVSIDLFGITDRKNVVSFTHYKQRSNLFTEKYQPKPAFYTFRSAWSVP